MVMPDGTLARPEVTAFLTKHRTAASGLELHQVTCARAGSAANKSIPTHPKMNPALFQLIGLLLETDLFRLLSWLCWEGSACRELQLSSDSLNLCRRQGYWPKEQTW